MSKKRSAPSSLPEDTISLHHFHQLPKNDFGSVCGLIVDFRPISKSRGFDYQQLITVKDMHHGTNSDSDNLLKVKLFNKDSNLLVPVDRTGDVIYFRNLKRSEWANQTIGMSSWDTKFVLFLEKGLQNTKMRHGHDVVDHGRICTVRPPQMGDASVELQNYAINLARRLRGPNGGTYNSNTAANSAPTQTYARQSLWGNQPDSYYDQQYQQIKDLTPDSYSATIIGEIVKIYDDFHRYLDVYVTDYTSSSILRERSKSTTVTNGHPWPGPEGRMTLKIEVHEPHRSWMRMNLPEKEIAMFRNVRCKLSREADLEATLWPDRKFEEKILINANLPPDDHRVQSLLENKRAYYGDRRPENAFAALYGTTSNCIQGGITRSKKRRDKKLRQQRERLQAENGGPHSVTEHIKTEEFKDPSATEVCHSHGPQSKDNNKVSNAKKSNSVMSSKIIDAPSSPALPNSNKQVVTTDSHKLSSFSELVNNPLRRVKIPLSDGSTSVAEFPFVNVNHKVRLRVVDYEPEEVFQFARKSRQTPVDHGDERFEWWFTLLVIAAEAAEDRSEAEDGAAVPIHVDDEAGQALFGVNASAIINDEETFEAAQEKFYMLVGSTLPNSKNSSSGPSPSDQAKSSVPFAHWQKQVERGHFTSQSLARSEPFEACIREYGIRCQDDGCDHVTHRSKGDPWDTCNNGWRRMWGLHSTQIVKAERLTPERNLGAGMTRENAISLNISDDD